MRNRKFRAWDQGNKRYWHDGDLFRPFKYSKNVPTLCTITSHGIHYLHTFDQELLNDYITLKKGDRTTDYYANWEYERLVKGCVIEEHTGYGDIFENDIVELSFWDYYSNNCVTMEAGSSTKGRVTFTDGCWFVVETDHTWYPLYELGDSCSIKIIGTVHDKKED